MTPDLAHDRGDGEGDELRSPLGIESVDSVEQAETGDLNQVVAWFSAAHKTTCDVLGQWEASRDDAFPHSSPFGIIRRQLDEFVE